MVGTVETLASPVKMEDWEATLAKKSSDSLEKWKASLVQFLAGSRISKSARAELVAQVDEPVSKTKVSIEVDQTHKEAVQEVALMQLLAILRLISDGHSWSAASRRWQLRAQIIWIGFRPMNSPWRCLTLKR